MSTQVVYDPRTSQVKIDHDMPEPIEYIPNKRVVKKSNLDEEDVSRKAQKIIDDYLKKILIQKLNTKKLIDKETVKYHVEAETKDYKLPQAAKLVAKKSLKKLDLGKNFKKTLMGNT